ncbi:probable WRKY transcription factor 35 [Arachis stenosperma]|uniref:probable WRKY transcription factor 35 n=1 Tax=Arachis stenosperma TaxID=217475 RepID=UPI0025AC868E|nr:probable WRKY transcription factor 35 [Arachis stenosperma]
MENNNNKEKYYQGDLSDIIRASYGYYGSYNSASSEASYMVEDPPMMANFGDPFSNSAGDPLLHDMPYFNTLSWGLQPATCDDDDDDCIMTHHQISHPNPNLLLPTISTCQDSSSTIMTVNNNSTKPSSAYCLVDNNTGPMVVQISAPVNKRRKSQPKKSICIPAAAAPSSRQGGEVVPSDLWAWRKYGQKPIKGSPYPRGYYRCSSTKGCPARKQVERSRTDPNMLVITYTSEHNHSWPTQRNALAGSSRSNKNTITTKPEEQQHSNTDSNTALLAVKKEDIHNNNNLEDLFAELGQVERDYIC